MSPSLLAVLGTSLLGSLHCAGMCGPLAAITHTPGRVHLKVAGQHRGAMGYHGGRLLSYALLGALAGLAGALLDAGGIFLGLQSAATVLAGGTLVALGVRSLIRRNVNSSTSGLSRHAARLRGRPWFPFALGGLTGLMPCGWLWAYVAVAAGTAAPLRGALVMATFWLGTVPALLGIGVGMQHLGRRLGPHVRWIVPVLCILAGTFTLVTRAPRLRATPTSATAPCH